MRLYTWIALLIITGVVSSSAKPAKTPPSSPEKIEQNTRLQVFLDNAGFGPGKIDGREGEFTKKALSLYRQSKGQGSPAPADPKAPLDVTGLDLAAVEPVFTDYVVTEEDAANVGELPGTPEAQAKVKRLPYATLAEAIAEKFHSDVDFVKELNPGKTEKIKVGDTLKVPAVKPFELGAVKSIQPGSEAAATVAANDLGEDPTPTADAPEVEAKPDAKSSGAKPADGKSADAKAAAGPVVFVRVSVKNEMCEVHSGDKIVAAFPVTIGSQQTKSPIGEWKVKGVAKMPNFRYDKKMLNEGERSSNFHMLPPGPNNPVGVVWIALNKKGIGMHGTNDPDSIGRSASHGCIRLANWDIARLAELVKGGVAVTVE
jgi:lipoprotein-anchoring transpeptidase ErfK/SrfK